MRRSSRHRTPADVVLQSTPAHGRAVDDRGGRDRAVAHHLAQRLHAVEDPGAGASGHADGAGLDRNPVALLTGVGQPGIAHQHDVARLALDHVHARGGGGFDLLLELHRREGVLDVLLGHRHAQLAAQGKAAGLDRDRAGRGHQPQVGGRGRHGEHRRGRQQVGEHRRGL
jgi:hypothetical protein